MMTPTSCAETMASRFSLVVVTKRKRRAEEIRRVLHFAASGKQVSLEIFCHGEICGEIPNRANHDITNRDFVLPSRPGLLRTATAFNPYPIAQIAPSLVKGAFQRAIPPETLLLDG